ncbi:hypothetical protein MRX96_009837 [Rhipicephalus microplus]
MSSSQKSDFISNAYHFLAMFGTLFVDSIRAIAGPFECLPVYQLATKDEPEPKLRASLYSVNEGEHNMLTETYVRSPTPRCRTFGTTDSNDWTTTNPANTAALSADDFPNLTDVADKTNAV